MLLQPLDSCLGAVSSIRKTRTQVLVPVDFSFLVFPGNVQQIKHYFRAKYQRVIYFASKNFAVMVHHSWLQITLMFGSKLGITEVNLRESRIRDTKQRSQMRGTRYFRSGLSFLANVLVLLLCAIPHTWAG